MTSKTNPQDIQPGDVVAWVDPKHPLPHSTLDSLDIGRVQAVGESGDVTVDWAKADSLSTEDAAEPRLVKVPASAPSRKPHGSHAHLAATGLAAQALYHAGWTHDRLAVWWHDPENPDGERLMFEDACTAQQDRWARDFAKRLRPELPEPGVPDA